MSHIFGLEFSFKKIDNPISVPQTIRRHDAIVFRQTQRGKRQKQLCVDL